MDLRQDTINKLTETVKLDKSDLANLDNPNVRKIAGLRGMLDQHDNEVKKIKRDLADKQKALAFVKDHVTNITA